MRVLHVTSSFPRDETDTTGPFIADLVVAERAAGIDVSVVAPHASGVTEAIAGVPVRRFRYAPVGLERLAYGAGLMTSVRSPAGLVTVPSYVAGMAWATASELRRCRFDGAHAHWWLPGGLACALARRPFVVTLHGSDVAIAGRLRPLARWVLSRAAAVVAVSPALAEEAMAVTGIPTIGVAPMPVPPFDVGSAPRHGLLAVGRLAPEKGFDVLVEAMKLTGDDVTLDLIGDGPLAPDLRAQAGPRVRFLGALTRAEYLERLGRAVALVVPSRREGLGLVAVEAVLAGTPVIASDVGGLPSVLAGDGGVLVPPEDPGALATALDGAAGLPPPGPAARAAAARHAPAAVAQIHLALYEEAFR